MESAGITSLTPREINALKNEAAGLLADDYPLRFLEKVAQLHAHRVYLEELKPTIIKFLAHKDTPIKEAAYALAMKVLVPTDELLLLCVSTVLRDLKEIDLDLKSTALDFIFKLIPESLSTYFSREVETLARQSTMDQNLRTKSILILSRWTEEGGLTADFPSLAKLASREAELNVILAYLFLFESRFKVEPKAVFSALVALNEWVDRPEAKVVEKCLRLWEGAIALEPKLGDKMLPKFLKILEAFEASEKHVHVTAFMVRTFLERPEVVDRIAEVTERHLKFSPGKFARRLTLVLLQKIHLMGPDRKESLDLLKKIGQPALPERLRLRLLISHPIKNAARDLPDLLNQVLVYYGDRPLRFGKFMTQRFFLLAENLEKTAAPTEAFDENFIKNLAKIIRSNSANGAVLGVVRRILEHSPPVALQLTAEAETGQLLFSSSLFSTIFDLVEAALMKETPAPWQEIRVQLQKSVAADDQDRAQDSPAAILRRVLLAAISIQFPPLGSDSTAGIVDTRSWEDLSIAATLRSNLPKLAIGP